MRVFSNHTLNYNNLGSTFQEFSPCAMIHPHWLGVRHQPMDPASSPIEGDAEEDGGVESETEDSSLESDTEESNGVCANPFVELSTCQKILQVKS
jgi:hypothetical protein